MLEHRNAHFFLLKNTKIRNALYIFLKPNSKTQNALHNVSKITKTWDTLHNVFKNY